MFSYLDDGTTHHVDMTAMFQQAVEKAAEATALDEKGKHHYEMLRNIDTTFFKVSFFKKGTMHIEFKDQRLLDAFNIFGARKKGWLPPSYGKTAYDNMEAEEQAVVDSFQGKDAYDQVMADKAFYLQEPGTKRLMLTGE